MSTTAVGLPLWPHTEPPNTGLSVPRQLCVEQFQLVPTCLPRASGQSDLASSIEVAWHAF